MAVATPLSLNNIVNEFGQAILSTNEYNGTGSATAPLESQSATFEIVGAGGGSGATIDYLSTGQQGGGGGAGGYIKKTLNVTGGVTVFSYSIGTGGMGDAYPPLNVQTDGGDSSVTVESTTYIGRGGKKGISGPSGGAGGDGGITSGVGDVNINGGAGDPGSSGGGQGFSAWSPGTYGDGGSGGPPDDSAGNPGENGRLKIYWRGKEFSKYTRGGGAVPNHAANSNIPTNTTGLSISDFSGAELNFSAVITTGDNGAGLNIGSYGYTQGSFGSINRTQIGTRRDTLDTATFYEFYESGGPFYDLFGNFVGYLYIATFSVSGDKTYSTLGYHFFDNVNNGTTYLNRTAAFNPDGEFDGTKTSWLWFTGFSRLFAISGTQTITLTISG